jgi:uncharacterized damage-inducible protein DinB
MIGADGIRRLFRYNAWANERTFGALTAVPRTMYEADVKSSHGGIHGTMVHVVFAQHVWLLRWQGSPIEAAVQASKSASSLEALRALWLDIETRTDAFLGERLSDALLIESFTMKTAKGVAFSHTYGDSMLHLVNHSSYHRGQVAAMLRQEGVAPPGTDFILYAREHPPVDGSG